MTGPVISTQAFRARPPDAPAVHPPATVDASTLFRIERFLLFEARLLDEARYNDWYDLLAEDLHYFVPLRRNHLHRDLATESSLPGGLAHYDDDRGSIAIRIRRLQQPTAWSDNPPPRTVRAVTNVEAEPADGAGAVVVRSVLVLHRNRLADVADGVAARRTDLLRPDPADGFRIARRVAHLVQSTVLSTNLGVFL